MSFQLKPREHVHFWARHRYAVEIGRMIVEDIGDDGRRVTKRRAPCLRQSSLIDESNPAITGDFFIQLVPQLPLIFSYKRTIENKKFTFI